MVISNINTIAKKPHQWSAGLEPVSTAFHNSTSDYRYFHFRRLQITAAKRGLNIVTQVFILLSVGYLIYLSQPGSSSHRLNLVVLGSSRRLRDVFLRSPWVHKSLSLNSRGKLIYNTAFTEKASLTLWQTTRSSDFTSIHSAVCALNWSQCHNPTVIVYHAMIPLNLPSLQNYSV